MNIFNIIQNSIEEEEEERKESKVRYKIKLTKDKVLLSICASLKLVKIPTFLLAFISNN